MGTPSERKEAGSFYVLKCRRLCHSQKSNPACLYPYWRIVDGTGLNPSEVKILEPWELLDFALEAKGCSTEKGRRAKRPYGRKFTFIQHSQTSNTGKSLFYRISAWVNQQIHVGLGTYRGAPKLDINFGREEDRKEVAILQVSWMAGGGVCDEL